MQEKYVSEEVLHTDRIVLTAVVLDVILENEHEVRNDLMPLQEQNTNWNPGARQGGQSPVKAF